ncbi:BppU family phage baseplate upper protein [Enterococcus faecium]|nr:BppU family phage baseplate upper protein [Enterococcus faecium]
MNRKTGEIVVPTEPVSRATKITGFTFKSYDKSAGVLQFQIKNQDGSPTDLIDATVRLFMYIYQGEEKKEFPIFDNQIITESYMQGIVKYPIPDMLLSYEGKVDANVYIDFPDGSHTDNLAFTFNIEKSIIDGDVQLNGEYYFKDFQQLLDGVKQEATDAVNEVLEHANQKITEYDQYIASGKSDWEDFVNQNREIIESVDPGGLVLTELIDSRKSGGIVYPSLSDRLNNTDRQNNLVKSRLFFGDNNVLIGHRGCSGFAPENSKKAFELAYYQGMAGIETDLTNTTDGVIFCYHDETLDTKTDGTGNPRELTWDYVSTVKLTKAAGYDAYPNTKIATLDDYLSVAKKYNLIIFPEVALSTEDLIHEALDKIYLYGLQSQCVILVNKWNYQIVKSYAPNLIRCLIPSWGVANTDDIDFCATNGIEICGAAFSAGLTAVPQSFIDYANEKGIYLYGYIINATKDLSRIKDLGIKFIGTDVFGGDN